jgi:uncharacterized protein YndB with AHSA1/START domain
MSDRIEKSVELNAPIERVWRALVDHEEFGAWFRVKLDQPFVPGGVSTGQMTYPGYEHLPWKAQVVAMDEPRLFSFRWPHMDEKQEVREDWPWTLVEFRLEPTEIGTRLTVTESGFDSLPAERRAENYRGNEQGWAEQMGNIKAYAER